MKITFLGAAHEVTGSSTLIEVGDKKGLVDCGMEQGKDLFVNEPLPIPASQLDFVLLTHAHIDHAGKLPLLYKQGFRGPIYATAATCSLCDIMLRDCANIQMSEAEYKNRKGQRSGAPHEEPLYDLDDAIGAIGLLRPCDYGRVLQVNDCVSLRMTDVGHLLGSAAIEVWLRERGETRKITFSGDVGNLSQPILRDPQLVEDTEYLVIESTYGDRLHTEERVDYVQELAARIQATLDRGGNMVIPSFAVGRTQEMLYFIREIKERGLVTGHGDFPVYVDSPLAIEATSVFLQCDTQFLDEEMQRLIRAGVNPIVFPGLELTVSDLESKAINDDKTPKVILSASGMCDAGRVRHHLKHNLWCAPRSTPSPASAATRIRTGSCAGSRASGRSRSWSLSTTATRRRRRPLSNASARSGAIRPSPPTAARSSTCSRGSLSGSPRASRWRRRAARPAGSAPPSPGSSPRRSGCWRPAAGWRVTPTRSWPATPTGSKSWPSGWNGTRSASGRFTNRPSTRALVRQTGAS